MVSSFFFFLEGLALVNHCSSAVSVIYHVHNLLTEDLREICVSSQWMLFHAIREGIVSAKDSCFDQSSAGGCGWTKEEFEGERLIEKAGIQR